MSLGLGYLYLGLAAGVSTCGNSGGSNVLVGQGLYLLLFYLIIGEVLLILLPARPRGRRLWKISQACLQCEIVGRTMLIVKPATKGDRI